MNTAGDNNSTATPTAATQPRFTRWCRSVMSPYFFIAAIAAVIGALCGAAAFAFKWLLAEISGIFIPLVKGDGINWWIIAIPTAGIILTGLFNRYIIHDNPSNGTGRIINDLNNGNYRLRGDLVYSPIVASSITLGMGGTSGSEGPIAYAGAAIGSNMGKLFRLDDDTLRTLIGCGTSAGIAGIFLAPVGGIMFGLEVIRIKLNTTGVLAVTIACLMSFFVIAILKGLAPDMTFIPSVRAEHLNFIPMVLLGVFCGIYSLYYSCVVRHMDSVFTNIKNPLARNITGGVAIGMCLLCFPSMFGVGYPVIQDVINGHPESIASGSIVSTLVPGDMLLIISCVGLMMLKCWGVSATNSSGGVGGDFAPTLFAGCMAGFLFAALCNNWLSIDIPAGVFAFLGMAGVMSGAIEAPLMTIFIVTEMTHSFDFAVPIIIVATVSYVTVMIGKRLANIQGRMVRHITWFLKNEKLKM